MKKRYYIIPPLIVAFSFATGSGKQAYSAYLDGYFDTPEFNESCHIANDIWTNNNTESIEKRGKWQLWAFNHFCKLDRSPPLAIKKPFEKTSPREYTL